MEDVLDTEACLVDCLRSRAVVHTDCSWPHRIVPPCRLEVLNLLQSRMVDTQRTPRKARLKLYWRTAMMRHRGILVVARNPRC